MPQFKSCSNNQTQPLKPRNQRFWYWPRLSDASLFWLNLNHYIIFEHVNNEKK